MLLRSLLSTRLAPKHLPFPLPARPPSLRGICTITSLDHLVLTVSSLQKTLDFYSALGMKHEKFAVDTSLSPSSSDAPTERHALRFGQSKINLHIKGKEFEPKARTALPGTGDLCFLVQEDVGEVLKGLKEKGVEVLEGGEVVKRTGARGALRSVYVRDPDGNLIELSNYADGPQ